MSIEPISTWRFERKPGERSCDFCRGERTVAVNWFVALEASNGDAHADTSEFGAEFQRLSEALRPVRKLRFGELFECRHCGRWWFLGAYEDIGDFMQSIPDLCRDRVERWDSRSLRADEVQLRTLSEIGATPPDLYGNGGGSIEVPCRAILADGRTIDPPLAVFSMTPPIQDERDNIVWIDEVETLGPTALALPLDVRVGCGQVDEIAMGHSPCEVQGAGQRFTLNGRTHFFRSGDITGSSIRLLERIALGRVRRSRGPGADINPTYVIADLTGEVEAALGPHHRPSARA